MLATLSKSSLTSEEKKKKMPAHKMNPDYPPKAYGHFVREVTLEYHKRCTLWIREKMGL
jgi:hypothetical protein